MAIYRPAPFHPITVGSGPLLGAVSCKLNKTIAIEMVVTFILAVAIPVQSKYGIFAYIYHKNQPNVDKVNICKYTVRGSSAYWWPSGRTTVSTIRTPGFVKSRWRISGIKSDDVICVIWRRFCYNVYFYMKFILRTFDVYTLSLYLYIYYSIYRYIYILQYIYITVYMSYRYQCSTTIDQRSCVHLGSWLPRFECHTSGKIGPPRGAHPFPVIVFFWVERIVGSTTGVMKYDTNPKQYKFVFWRKIPETYQFALFDAPNIDPVPWKMMNKWISFGLGELEVDLTGWKSQLCFYGFCLFYIFLDMLQL